jgi:hypothetical protein
LTVKHQPLARVVHRLVFVTVVEWNVALLGFLGQVFNPGNLLPQFVLSVEMVETFRYRDALLLPCLTVSAMEAHQGDV